MSKPNGLLQEITRLAIVSRDLNLSGRHHVCWRHDSVLSGLVNWSSKNLAARTSRIGKKPSYHRLRCAIISTTNMVDNSVEKLESISIESDGKKDGTVVKINGKEVKDLHELTFSLDGWDENIWLSYSTKDSEKPKSGELASTTHFRLVASKDGHRIEQGAVSDTAHAAFRKIGVPGR